MNYVAYKLDFMSSIHFGNGTLESCNIYIGADTLFSALYIEAMKYENEYEDRLLKLVKSNKLKISDAFPYIGSKLYVPKPLLKIKRENESNSKEKKANKNLPYVPIEALDDFINGKADVEALYDNYSKNIGVFHTRNVASIRKKQETVPYHIGSFAFEKDSGLYIIIGYEEKDDALFVEELLESLSFSGIGGKRSSGYGRFTLRKVKELPEEFEERLGKEGNTYILMSVALPKDEELDLVLRDANYSLVKRSGFVESENYAEVYLKKKDLYVLASGSCVRRKFDGDIYDVSVGGNHSVYRYAKPLFMEVQYWILFLKYMT